MKKVTTQYYRPYEMLYTEKNIRSLLKLIVSISVVLDHAEYGQCSDHVCWYLAKHEIILDLEANKLYLIDKSLDHELPYTTRLALKQLAATNSLEYWHDMDFPDDD